MEIIYTLSSEEEDPHNLLYTKTVLGEICIPNLISLGTDTEQVLIKAKRESLDTVLKLVYGCEANLGIAVSTLSESNHNFKDYLSGCGDYKTQLVYLDIMYRLHKYASKKAKSCRFSAKFLEQDFAGFDKKKLFQQKFSSYKDMEMSCMKVLNSFNAKSNDAIIFKKVKAVVMTEHMKDCDLFLASGRKRDGNQENVVCINQSWVSFSPEYLTFSIELEDDAETVDVPLKYMTEAKLEGGKGALLKLLISADVDPAEMTSFLDPGSGVTICILGTKAVLQDIKEVCVIAIDANERSQADQKISRGIPFTTSCNAGFESRLGKEKSAEDNTKTEKMFDVEAFKAKYFLGRKVGIWWSHDERFYYGKITACDEVEGKVNIQYEDGEEEWISPSEEKIDFCPGEPFTGSDRSPHSSLAKEQEEELSMESQGWKESRKELQEDAERKVKEARRKTSESTDRLRKNESKPVKKKPVGKIVKPQRKKPVSPKKPKSTKIESSHVKKEKVLPRTLQSSKMKSKNSKVKSSPVETSNSESESKQVVTMEAERSKSTSEEESSYYSDDMYVPEEDEVKPEKKKTQKNAYTQRRTVAPTSGKGKAKISNRGRMVAKKPNTKQKRSPARAVHVKTEPQVQINHLEESLTPESDDIQTESFQKSTESEMDYMAIANEPPKSRKRKYAPEPDPLGFILKEPNQERISSLFSGNPSFDLEPSVLTTSTAEENDMNALHQMIEGLLSNRREKKARRKRKVVETFQTKLQEDSTKLKGYIEGAIQDSLEFCSDVHSDITKEFEIINSKMKKCVSTFTNEIQALSKGYSKFLASIAQRERLVDSFTNEKMAHSLDLLKKAKSRAELLMSKTKQKIEELNKKKDSIPQISSLLNTLLMEE